MTFTSPRSQLPLGIATQPENFAENDRLGEEYCASNPASARRAEGITLTPDRVVQFMVRRLARNGSQFRRVVDAGAGTGRFAIAAAEAFPHAEIIAVERNHGLVAILRNNLAAAGLSQRIAVLERDYCEVAFAAIDAPTLYLGNPPYVRHHDLPPEHKERYARLMAQMGVKASRLAGVHLHFFAHTVAQARPGDCISFVTAAEWLDVAYGSALRSLLLRRAEQLEITLVDRAASLFDDAMTTSAITTLCIGTSASPVRFGHVDAALTDPSGEICLSRDRLHALPRWNPAAESREAALRQLSGTTLGDVFVVHRGQVTGMNSVWIANGAGPPLPARVMFPAVTRASELIAPEQPVLVSDRPLRRVVDLPPDLDSLESHERQSVQAFLAWARRAGAHQSYIAMHRKPWYRVGLRDPAPIVMTYMARRPPRFVRNLCNARIINIAHGLYPRSSLVPEMMDTLTAWLNANVSSTQGRTYAGGLAKFEPGEVMRLRIPHIEELLEPTT